MRPQVELIEMMLMDRGHADWNLSKPLSYNQISYIAYIVFGIEIGRHPLQKHFFKCMGMEYLKSPVYYNRHLGVWLNQKGEVIPKDQVGKYKRTRSHGTLNQDPPLHQNTSTHGDTKQTP
jgi:hypothetical protein